MILNKVTFKGMTVLPHQIVNNKCYYFKNGKVIDFAYRLTKLPDYYVAGEALYMDTSTTTVEEDKAILTSLRIFKVKDDSLVIKS